MPIQYKVNVVEKLKEAGYSTYRIRNEKIIGERALQQLRQGELVSWAVLEKICELLDCEPGDLLRRSQEETEEADV